MQGLQLVVAVTRKWVALVALACCAALLPARPAHGHVAILLVVLEPREGARALADADVVVFAQPTLGGVDSTTFSVSLDGRPIDPETGRPSSGPVEATIRVEETLRVPLPRLSDGSHTLAIRYRPDVDEPTRQTTVTFMVGSSAFPLLSAAIALVGGAILWAAIWVALRRSRKQARSVGGRPSGSG